MRFMIVAVVLTSALPLAAGAFAQTAPKIGETKDADIKAEYLESIPYKPCPANVRFPNGQQRCLGLPGYLYSRSRPYHPN
jgi:hypothetical protein